MNEKPQTVSVGSPAHGSAFVGPQPNTITFCARDAKEILKIGPDGFWVRGVAVPQGEGEAAAVYAGFLAWLEEAKENSLQNAEISYARERKE